MWIVGHTVQTPIYFLVNFGALEWPNFLQRSFNIDPISNKFGVFVDLGFHLSGYVVYVGLLLYTRTYIPPPSGGNQETPHRMEGDTLGSRYWYSDTQAGCWRAKEGFMERRETAKQSNTLQILSPVQWFNIRYSN